MGKTPRKSKAAGAGKEVSLVAVQLATEIRDFPLLEQDEHAVPMAELIDLVTVKTKEWAARVQQLLKALDKSAAMLPDAKRSAEILNEAGRLGPVVAGLRQQIVDTVAGFKAGQLEAHERRDALLWSWNAIKANADKLMASVDTIRTLAQRDPSEKTELTIVLTNPSRRGRGVKGADVHFEGQSVHVTPSTASLIKDVFTNGVGWHPFGAFTGRNRGGADNQLGLKQAIPQLARYIKEAVNVKPGPNRPRTSRNYILIGDVHFTVIDHRTKSSPKKRPSPK